VLGRYHDGSPCLELPKPLDLKSPPRRSAKVAIFRAKIESLNALGTDGTHSTRNPDVISPTLHNPMGPTLNVISSVPSAFVVEASRTAPHTHPLCPDQLSNYRMTSPGRKLTKRLSQKSSRYLSVSLSRYASPRSSSVVAQISRRQRQDLVSPMT
jgi:hypothetical protein